MTSFELHPASVCDDRGKLYIDRQNKKIKRIMTPQNVRFISSDTFKEKAGHFWPNVTKGDNEFYNIEYIEHPIYFLEMTNKQIGELFKFYCNIMEYICNNSEYTIASHQWNVVASGGQYYLIDTGDFVLNNGDFTKNSIKTWWNSHSQPRHPSTWLNNHETIKKLAEQVQSNGDGIGAVRQAVKANLKEDPTNNWDNYTGVFSSVDDMIKKSQNEKDKTVHDWVREVMPDTLTDLGCNSGKQTLMAANLGIKSVGIDYAARSINTAMTNARNMKLKCSFAAIDILNPNIIESQKNGQRYELPSVRLKSDVVVASALIHHLYMACWDINRVVDTVVDYSTKHVAIEVIPKEDSCISQHKEKWFDIENIRKRLNFHGYKVVREANSHPAPRTWIFASKHGEL